MVILVVTVSECILKVDSTEFSDELNVECERKRGIKVTPRLLSQANGRVESILAEDKTM